MAYSVGKHGMDALDKIDGEVLLKSLRNMALTEGIERVVGFFKRCHPDSINGDRGSMRELSSMMVPPDNLVDEFERSWKKLRSSTFAGGFRGAVLELPFGQRSGEATSLGPNPI
jgi:H2-forming N5,N10-methylenetetrahydromethanopterin dehydrogenase-like enzyme